MARTILIFLLSLILLTACSPGPQYQDGTYSAYSEADDYGYARAEVTISGNEIEDVRLEEFTGKGEPLDFSTYPYQPTVEGVQVIKERFIEANSADVDTYTGSTHSSQKYIDAVEKALKIALDDPEEEIETDFWPGTFLGTAEKQNIRAVAWVSIKDDRIIDVFFNEVDLETGEFFDWDNREYEILPEARREMQERIVLGGTLDVDTFSGATESSELWLQAAENAREKARIE